MNLRQAAEALLNHWEAGEYKNCTGYMAGHIRVLREALAHEALDRMVAENQRFGLYEDGPAVKPNYCTPEETPEETPEVPCKTHPDAPHGFDRNASHSADRYVCECEGWEPVDNAYTKLDTTAGVLHKEWVGLTDEEIQAERHKLDPTAGWTYDHFARAIEAKLKEKNSPEGCTKCNFL